MVGWGFTMPWEERASYKILEMKTNSLWFGEQRPVLSVNYAAIRASCMSEQPNPGSNTHFLGDDTWVPEAP